MNEKWVDRFDLKLTTFDWKSVFSSFKFLFAAFKNLDLLVEFCRII